ncbi:MULTISPECIES: glycerophosphoryl diester phosphodiesterase membrane domain-containing protein [Streptomycetaceae]|nr:MULTISPECIES: glycerophosphoryl diester phosphodiesterase membrane domain-containing protein [Streptomycetaceae]
MPGMPPPGPYGHHPAYYAAPKPGVIPLRPLSVSDLLEGAVAAVRAHWRTALGVSLSVSVVVQAISTAVNGAFFAHTANPYSLTTAGRYVDPGEALRSLRRLTAQAAVTSIVGMLGQVLAIALLTMVVSRSVLGRPVTFAETWRDARPQLGRLLGLLLVVVVVPALGLGIGIVPGAIVADTGSVGAGIALVMLGGAIASAVVCWLAVSLSLSAPTLMLEKQGVRAALTRSFRLVRGSWWRIFGIGLLSGLLVFLLTALLQVPFTTIALSAGPVGSWPNLVVTAVGAVIGTTLALPFTAGMTTLLYIDQRIRREGLDIELARAAGIQGYGATR